MQRASEIILLATLVATMMIARKLGSGKLKKDQTSDYNALLDHN